MPFDRCVQAGFQSIATRVRMTRDLISLWHEGSVQRCLAERPRPSQEHAEDEPIQPGSRFLEELFIRFLRRCRLDERADVPCWATCMKRGQIQIATACSGTGVPVLAWVSLARALHQELNVSLTVVHRFSCEADGKKRGFIRKMFGDCPAIFLDARQLGQSSAEEVGHC
jgi:hypothetical protein